MFAFQNQKIIHMLRILRVAGRRVALRLPHSSSTYSHTSSSSTSSLSVSKRTVHQLKIVYLPSPKIQSSFYFYLIFVYILNCFFEFSFFKVEQLWQSKMAIGNHSSSDTSSAHHFETSMSSAFSRSASIGRIHQRR